MDIGVDKYQLAMMHSLGTDTVDLVEASSRKRRLTIIDEGDNERPSSESEESVGEEGEDSDDLEESPDQINPLDLNSFVASLSPFHGRQSISSTAPFKSRMSVSLP